MGSAAVGGSWGWLESGMKCARGGGRAGRYVRQAHSAADMQVDETRQGGVCVMHSGNTPYIGPGSQKSVAVAVWPSMMAMITARPRRHRHTLVGQA
jgi:hypothetical protein